jgi:hypothetical protein
MGTEMVAEKSTTRTDVTRSDSSNTPRAPQSQVKPVSASRDMIFCLSSWSGVLLLLLATPHHRR